MNYSENTRGKVLGFALCAVLFTVPVQSMLPSLNRDTIKAAIIGAVGGMWCYYKFGATGRAILANNNRIPIQDTTIQDRMRMLEEFATRVAGEATSDWTPEVFEQKAAGIVDNYSDAAYYNGELNRLDISKIPLTIRVKLVAKKENWEKFALMKTVFAMFQADTMRNERRRSPSPRAHSFNRFGHGCDNPVDGAPIHDVSPYAPRRNRGQKAADNNSANRMHDGFESPVPTRQDVRKWGAPQPGSTTVTRNSMRDTPKNES